MRRSSIWLSLVLCSFALSVAFAVAAAELQQRTDASVAATKLLEGMRQITDTPHTFDRAGRILGRTDFDLSRYTDLAMRLSDLIVNAMPAAIDAQVVDELIEQLRDPYAWINSTVLSRALGHIGPRAISKQVEMVRTSSNQVVRERVSEILASTVNYSDKRQADEQLVDNLSALLADRDLFVSTMAASALGSLGPGAARALPALERSLSVAEDKERRPGPVVGILSSDVIRSAISAIRSEPVP